MGFLDKVRGTAAPPAQATDPVCGMTVAPAKAAATSQHGGRTVYFCSPGCKRTFDANPAAFAGKL